MIDDGSVPVAGKQLSWVIRVVCCQDLQGTLKVGEAMKST